MNVYIYIHIPILIQELIHDYVLHPQYLINYEKKVRNKNEKEKSLH